MKNLHGGRDVTYPLHMLVLLVAINDNSESDVGEAPDSCSSNDHTALIAASTTTIIDAPPCGKQPLYSLTAAGETAMTQLRESPYGYHSCIISRTL